MIDDEFVVRWEIVISPKVFGEMPLRATDPERVGNENVTARTNRDLPDDACVDRHGNLALETNGIANQEQISTYRGRGNSIDFPRAQNRKPILSQEFDRVLDRFQFIDLQLFSLCSHGSPALAFAKTRA